MDAGYVARIGRLIDAHGWHHSVRLLGSIPDDALRRRLAGGHVLAVPSFEGFGIVYLEAMAFGLPVIASTAGAAHEIVDHGRNGYLVDPNDDFGLARRLAHLHGNREDLLRMSEAARGAYDRHATWRQSAQSIVRWLAERVAEPGGRYA